MNIQSFVNERHVIADNDNNNNNNNNQNGTSEFYWTNANDYRNKSNHNSNNRKENLVMGWKASRGGWVADFGSHL